MRVFVTGGTGLLGNTILRQLSDAGHSLIALVRGEPAADVFAGINAKFVIGDLSQSDVIDQAVASSDATIHSAALIHLGWHHREQSMQVNHGGTRIVADACRRHDRKLVYVGTVNTLAIGTREQPANEETPLDLSGGQVPCSYIDSKRAGVAEVLSAVENGLRATIVHPGFMLGPWDWKPSSGRMMLEIANNWTPIAPSGGTSLSDSRDVAAGTIAAIERGSDDGRQYILAGHNWTYKKVWDEMSVRVGSSKTIMKAGPVQRWIGSVAGDTWAKLTGNEPDINSASVKMSHQMHWYDSQRAIDELGYQIRPAAESLDACRDWMKEHHLK